MLALDPSLLRLTAALAVGLLLGVERGWSLRGETDGSRVAGIRTFVLLAMAGGIAGVVATSGAPLIAAATFVAAAAILLVAYAPELTQRRDATSAVAAVIALALGAVAGLGRPSLAVAVAAVVLLVLALRAELHGFIDRLEERDVKAMARFAVIALAVLPFLPEGKFGPYLAWDPRQLWWIVVLVTGFSFAAHIASRLFGERRGTLATAIIGGTYSSTAVTQSLAQRLRAASAEGVEAAGIAAASAVMYLRVTILIAILAPRLLLAFAPLVAPAFVVAVLAAWWLYRREAKGAESARAVGNPIAVIPALGFVAFLALTVVVSRWAGTRFGESGIAALLVIIGSFDVDAAIVTAGGLPSAAITAQLAALAIGGTIVVNMLVKIGVTLAYARSAGRQAALALAASTAVLALGIAIGISPT